VVAGQRVDTPIRSHKNPGFSQDHVVDMFFHSIYEDFLHYHPGKLVAQVQLIIIFQMVMVTKKYKKNELRSPKIWFFFLRSAIFPPVDHPFESRRTMRLRPGSRAVRRPPRPSGHREKHQRLRGQRIRRCPVNGGSWGNGRKKWEFSSQIGFEEYPQYPREIGM